MKEETKDKVVELVWKKFSNSSIDSITNSKGEKCYVSLDNVKSLMKETINYMLNSHGSKV